MVTKKTDVKKVAVNKAEKKAKKKPVAKKTIKKPVKKEVIKKTEKKTIDKKAEKVKAENVNTENTKIEPIIETTKESNALGITGFVISLAGLVLFWFPFLGALISIFAGILSGIQMYRKTNGFAIAGLAISIIALLLNLAIIVYFIMVFKIILTTILMVFA